MISFSIWTSEDFDLSVTFHQNLVQYGDVAHAIIRFHFEKLGGAVSSPSCC